MATKPEYGSLQTLYDQLIDQFLQKKPYQQKPFYWKKPAKQGTLNWISYNVVNSKEISMRVKDEAFKLEVSLTIFLYTALDWWVTFNQSIKENKDNSNVG